MKMNKWTMGLAAAGVVSLASTAQAEENSVLTALSSTVISGSVEASYNGTFSKDNNLYGDQGFVALTPNLIDQLEAALPNSVRCRPDLQQISVKGRGQVSTGILRQSE